MKIGFVGLGLMGQPMVERLLAAGHRVHIYSHDSAALQRLADHGAIPARSVTDVVGEVDIFCSCRVTAEQSRSVFTGTDSVLSAPRRPSVCIDFATIDPSVSRAIGQRLAEQDVDFLDAPISGGPGGAGQGTLSIIVGGASDAVAAATPVFDALGKRTFHMGGIGSGVTTKLCNNMISITTHALVAQAMVLGARSGIDCRALYEVMYNSSAYSRTLERVVPGHFLPRNFKAAASIDTIIKDLQGAIDLAHAQGVNLSLPEAAMQCFLTAAQQGHSGDDIASVILPLEEVAGVRVEERK
jgi:3-hydroxyisobutyrate dehydrogenase